MLCVGALELGLRAVRISGAFWAAGAKLSPPMGISFCSGTVPKSLAERSKNSEGFMLPAAASSGEPATRPLRAESALMTRTGVEKPPDCPALKEIVGGLLGMMA